MTAIYTKTSYGQYLVKYQTIENCYNIGIKTFECDLWKRCKEFLDSLKNNGYIIEKR